MTSSLRLIANGSGHMAPFCGMVGAHLLMADLFEEIRHAAPLDGPALIEGETGTGKELVAQALHGLSGRKGSLVAVNAAELSEPLAEAELFGVVRGAYTGAVTNRSGLIMAADGGTLFLDEAAELPQALQLKLLRVLEAGRVRQVGAETDRAVRFRLLLSVQQPARELVASGRWRQDFYYRVAGISLRLPRLADRTSDIPALANHFLVELGSPPLAVEELAELGSHPWTGNVRELRRVVERALHRARGRAVTMEDVLHELEGETEQSSLPTPGSAEASLRDAERRHIERTLAQSFGHWHVAAAALGVSRSTFYRRLAELGIPLPGRRPFPELGTHSQSRERRSEN